MGKMIGMFDSFSGKVGNLVGSKWRDIAVVRRRPIRKNKNVSEEQLQQHAKFELVANFLRSMKSVVNEAYSPYKNMSGRNSAFSDIISRKALIGDYPNYKLDFKEVSVTKGKMDNTTADISVAEVASVRFRWDKELYGNMRLDDKAMLIAYNPATGRTYFSLGKAIRNDGEGILQLPTLTGAEVETWLSFTDVKGKLSADSLYTGRVIVS